MLSKVLPADECDEKCLPLSDVDNISYFIIYIKSRVAFRIVDIFFFYLLISSIAYTFIFLLELSLSVRPSS